MPTLSGHIFLRTRGFYSTYNPVSHLLTFHLGNYSSTTPMHAYYGYRRSISETTTGVFTRKFTRKTDTLPNIDRIAILKSLKSRMFYSRRLRMHRSENGCHTI